MHFSRTATSDLSLLHSRRRNSFGAFLGSLAAAVSGGADNWDDAEEESLQAGPRAPGQADLEALDTCTFGPHRHTPMSPSLDVMVFLIVIIEKHFGAGELSKSLTRGSARELVCYFALLAACSKLVCDVFHPPNY